MVFLAASPAGVHVAVKLMHSRLDEDRARRRFIGEVAAVQRVAPFCTAQVLEADLDGDRPYIVSEYVDGVSLQDDVMVNGPRTGGSLDRVAVGTATALAAIHGAGVVHRDFKPGNVLLGRDGPRVIDFGISRIMDTTVTTGRVPVGTPAYLSPEQLKGDRAGPAADLFGWALTVAFTASGRHAYAAGSFEATLGRILFGEADLDPLAGPLREIVVACLAEDPALRPSADDVLRHLIGQGSAPPPGRSAGQVLETGATLASAPTGEHEGPATLGLDPVTGDGPGTLDLEPVTGDGPGTLSLDPVTDDGPSTLDLEPVTEPGGPDTVDSRSSRDGLQTVEPRPRRWYHRFTVLAAAAVLASGTAGFALWQGYAGQEEAADAGFSYAGRWTGSAEHPTAERVFPVEIRLVDLTRPGLMRWGADLHCAGRLTGAGGGAAARRFRLDQVRGAECHPSMVELSPRGTDQVSFRVTRQGEKVPRYTGTAVRSS